MLPAGAQFRRKSMSTSNPPEQAQATTPRLPSPPAEVAGQVTPGPPRDVDYSARLREAERLVSSPDWQAHEATEGVGEVVEELGRLFPSDPRTAFVLLNEA